MMKSINIVKLMIKLSHYTLKQVFHSPVHYTKYPFSSAAGRCPHVSKVGIVKVVSAYFLLHTSLLKLIDCLTSNNVTIC